MGRDVLGVSVRGTRESTWTRAVDRRESELQTGRAISADRPSRAKASIELYSDLRLSEASQLGRRQIELESGAAMMLEQRICRKLEYWTVGMR